MTWVTALGLAILAANVGLTVYHAGIIRRARRYRADTERLHGEAERLLAHVATLAEAQAEMNLRLTSNGHRHTDGPEP